MDFSSHIRNLEREGEPKKNEKYPTHGSGPSRTGYSRNSRINEYKVQVWPIHHQALHQLLGTANACVWKNKLQLMAEQTESTRKIHDLHG
jgi:hypothetical protein